MESLVAEKLEFELCQNPCDLFLYRNQSSQILIQTCLSVEEGLTFLDNSFEEVAFPHFDDFFSGELLKTVIFDGLSV